MKCRKTMISAVVVIAGAILFTGCLDSSSDSGGSSGIVGTFQSPNYPSNGSGRWTFSSNGTFTSDFIDERSPGGRSTSSGRYTYSGTTLTLHFDTSTNPYLQGSTEVHRNVTVDHDLVFNDRGAIFIRQ